MKKTTKILLIGGILLVFVGAIIMLTTGSVLGMQKLQAFMENGDFAITIDNMERIGHFFQKGEFPERSEMLGVEKGKLGVSSEVQKLNIQFGAGEFHILESEDEYIYLEMDHSMPFEYGINQQNTLYVKPKKATMASSIGNINLYLPKNMAFDEVDLELGAGELVVNSLETKEFEVSVAAGSAKLNHLTCEQAELEVGAGELIVERGDIKNLSLDLAMGDVSLKLTGAEEDYDYDLACGAGEITVGSMSSSGFAFDKETSFGREKKINVECAMGSVEVEFIQ